MSLSRKRKKELEKLQKQASSLWEAQQVLVGEAATVAREAGRQLGKYGREQVAPQVQARYDQYAAPHVDRSLRVSRKVVNDTIIPAAGAVVGSAMSVWDAANDSRSRIGGGRSLSLPSWAKSAPVPVPVKKGIGAGGVIAIILGVAAALGVLYAAWQTLRADDELWVADDPLRAPDA
ncbi:DNA helicase [Microbacterium allomyrinae]|uniref:DNA helicase n=1 Tax=Microbacterium allomyrinae TaxID=2830666 RepID=A0A9X1LWA5_9MICO|nr:DNA helicase [Microbacterium allomyrinae]MCC2032813.1 DNA helicase [Microbacterium allomyrinae]